MDLHTSYYFTKHILSILHWCILSIPEEIRKIRTNKYMQDSFLECIISFISNWVYCIAINIVSQLTELCVSLQSYWYPSPFKTSTYPSCMTTSSNGNIFCITGPLWGNPPSERSVTRIFDVFFDLCLNKWLNIQSRCQWFEMPSHTLWRYCDDISNTMLADVLIKARSQGPVST